MSSILLLALAGCADSWTEEASLDVGAEAKAPATPAIPCDFFVPGDAPNIQEAIDRAESGDHLCVAAGTFNENLDFRGKTLLISGAGRNETIILGKGTAPTVVIDGGTGAGTALANLAIRGGAGVDGGGLRMFDANVHLEHVAISGNRASDQGAGIFAVRSYLSLLDVEVVDNHSNGSGAGIAMYDSTMDAVGLDLVRNISQGWGGGGLFAMNCSLDIFQSRILANRLPISGGEGTGGGGGIYGNHIDGLVSNSVIAGNSNVGRGGGLYVEGGADMIFENVVIAGNRALNGGAAFLLYPEVNVVFRNAAIVKNVATDEVGGVWLYENAKAFFEYSNIWQNSEENVRGQEVAPVGRNGNFSVAPGFKVFTLTSAPASWDFHLRETSPMIDKGHPEILDQNGSASDVGAYGGPGGTW